MEQLRNIGITASIGYTGWKLTNFVSEFINTIFRLDHPAHFSAFPPHLYTLFIGGLFIVCTGASIAHLFKVAYS